MNKEIQTLPVGDGGVDKNGGSIEEVWGEVDVKAYKGRSGIIRFQIFTGGKDFNLNTVQGVKEVISLLHGVISELINLLLQVVKSDK